MPVDMQVVRIGVYPHRVAETTAWEREQFEQAGFRYRFVEPSTSVELQDAVADADAIISAGIPFGDAELAAAPRCRVLVSGSVGLDRVDLDAASRRGVMVCNMPDLCTDEVADHAMALLLACDRKIVRLANRVAGGVWDRAILEPMPILRGATLGLLGFGRIARGVAERAAAFGMAVLAFDPYVLPGTASGAELVEVEELLRRSDFVSCHLPHGPTTHHFVDEARLALMKPTAYFVNTSRGKVVDEAALIDALQAGALAGVGLDVLEQEPPDPANPLLRMENAIVTPHAAGFSDQVVDRIPRLAVEEVTRVLRGGTPRELAWANRAAFARATSA
jgi:D-3-phosphoglycerate dehydrogenase